MFEWTKSHQIQRRMSAEKTRTIIYIHISISNNPSDQNEVTKSVHMPCRQSVAL